MSLTPEQAYAAIKNLENSGQLTLPQPQETIELGTIDATTGQFTYAVETVTQTYIQPPIDVGPPSLPPSFPPAPGFSARTAPAAGGSHLPVSLDAPLAPIGPGGLGGSLGGGTVGPPEPHPPVNILVGVVKTSAVDLRLKFKLVGATAKPPVAVARTVPAGAASSAITSVGGIFSAPSNIKVEGFPVVSEDLSQITLDAGTTTSSKLNTQNVTPPISVELLTVTINGASQFLHIMILRPPVLGVGAFTIPALPITLIYAPPQGKQNKNTASYTDTFTLTRALTSSMTYSKNTKTIQAYTAADILSKIESAISSVATLVAAVARVAPSSAGVGRSALAGNVAAISGSRASAGTVNVGGSSAAGDSGSGSSSGGGSGSGDNGDGIDTKTVSAELGLLKTILTAVGDTTTTTDSTTLTVENDHTITMTYSNTDMFGSAAGLGPGLGDRFVYMSNVRVVWMALNGEVGIHVLGFESVNAIAAEALLDDQHSLTVGGAATNTNLDAASLNFLLALDPFTVHRSVISVLQPALIGPPRFVPASPAERKGEGTSAAGDQFSSSYEITTEDKQVTTQVQSKVTEVKPGWLDVVFGAPNVDETDTLTFTVSQTTDTKTDEKITNSATFFSQGADDPYDVLIFYDRLFGTMAFAEKGSAVLGGGTGTVLQPSASAAHGS